MKPIPNFLTRLALCFALVFLGAALVGCEGDTTVVESPTAPNPVCGNDICETGENADNCSADCQTAVSINIGGGCNAGATDIDCRESSTSNPAGNIEVATWELFNSNGRSVATANVTGGCGTAPSPACAVPFSGLAPDTYSAVQTVKPNDGGPAATANYTDLVVTGGS